jgi:hypothetical protein
MKKALFLMPIVLSLVMCSRVLAGPKSTGQTVYVPAAHYDLTKYDEAGNPLLTQIATSKLYVRNVDPCKSLVLVSVELYDPEGQFVKEYLDEPETVNPLASVTFSMQGIELYDRPAGRGGPCFVVKWRARPDERVIKPMMGTGVSFMTPGQVPGTWEILAADSMFGKPIR